MSSVVVSPVVVTECSVLPALDEQLEVILVPVAVVSNSEVVTMDAVFGNHGSKATVVVAARYSVLLAVAVMVLECSVGVSVDGVISSVEIEARVIAAVDWVVVPTNVASDAERLIVVADASTEGRSPCGTK